MKKLNTKNYNVTDLDPLTTFEKHVFHRDQFAHYFRWSHILKELSSNDIVVDFGCGKGNLLEVLYRNRKQPKQYIGLDIRVQTINKSREKWKNLENVKFLSEDLVNPFDSLNFKADKVVSFEVAEHIGKQNIDKFLTNFRYCGNENATFYLSTPNYDENVGAANNHIYDSGDGRGKDIQEFNHNELEDIISKHFTIHKKYGTFASIKDYKHLMNEWQVNMFNELSKYYDVNILANLMAPFFPEQSRNTMWVLKNKK